MKAKIILISILFGLAFCVNAYSQQYNWTILDHPNALYGTSANGIDGSRIVGSYSNDSGTHGFLYDVGTEQWTSFDQPNGNYTIFMDIDGTRIVGTDYYSGFLYDLNTGCWTYIKYMSGQFTRTSGLDGDKVVGYTFYNSAEHGFLYDLATETWTFIDYPDAYSTYAIGIDRNRIVGYYMKSQSSPSSGFLYDISTGSWQTLNPPDSAGNTFLFGIDGSEIVGYYWDGNGWAGLLYNLDTEEWVTLSYPGEDWTFALGIDDSIIVGRYGGVYGKMPHGYMASPVPAPSSLILIASGILGLVLIRPRNPFAES